MVFTEKRDTSLVLALLTNQILRLLREACSHQPVSFGNSTPDEVSYSEPTQDRYLSRRRHHERPVHTAWLAKK